MLGTLSFIAPLWEYPGKAAWFFLTVPEAPSGKLRFFAPGPRRGFGAVKVKARIGASSWTTSVFPQKEGTYLLPVKAAIRAAESLAAGDEVRAELTIL